MFEFLIGFIAFCYPRWNQTEIRDLKSQRQSVKLYFLCIKNFSDKKSERWMLMKKIYVCRSEKKIWLLKF